MVSTHNSDVMRVAQTDAAIQMPHIELQQTLER